MGLSTNAIKNIYLKNYMSQMKNNIDNNINVENDTKNLNKQMQNLAFETMLNQMMESTNGSMMAEFLSTALTEDNSIGADTSLATLRNFNSAMRRTSYSQESLNIYSNGVNNKLSRLGLKASKYESNLNPGLISNNPGDYGGKSYGAWQFSSKTGSLNSFVSWLKGNYSEFYSKLSEAKNRDGSNFGKNFDSAWRNIALANRDKFIKVQQDYVKKYYYDKAALDLKSKFGFDVNKRSNALKESLWSTVVQHGVGGTLSIFSKLNLNNNDRNIINDLYNERKKVNIYFRSSSEQVKRSVYNRFTKEKQDMFNMLEKNFA
ncbi:vgrg protein [Clostridium aestuarii]|uniref:Vgrg protein n=1 Tax=Clostridium aestuarii TaxID=338193 RepID=A0ABT4CVE1_9CLOT|nr:vgrg protein [Clostridium aestuarii]MCY6482941.1 vgrg protein [Clostridium aestuarii]